MAIALTGLASMDDAHRDLQQCIRDLGLAARDHDADGVRGRACLLLEMFAEHFHEEEALMLATGWSRRAHHALCHVKLLERMRWFERRVAAHGVDHDAASFILVRLPELVRVHVIRSDFGFGKFALGVAGGPGAARSPARGGQRLGATAVRTWTRRPPSVRR
jgi:hemerythrin-like metal-binding protein